MLRHISTVPRPTLRCFFCDQERPASPYYLRLQQAGMSPGALLVGIVLFRGRCGFLKCYLCDDCRENALAVRRLRWTVVLVTLLLLPLSLFVLYPLVMPAASPDKTSLGEKLLVGLVLGLPLLNVALAPFYLHFLLRRRMRRLLHPETDRYLRSLGVVRDWGFWSDLILFRELPRGEKCLAP